MVSASIPLGTLIEALHQAGLVGATEPVVELSRVVGRQVETLSLRVGHHRNVWVQRLADPRQWEPAAKVTSALRAWPSIAASYIETVRPVLPVEVAAGVYAFPVPVRSDLVVDPLLQHLLGTAPSGPRWPWLPPLCGRLGAYLRAFHELTPNSGLSPDLPRPNHVVMAVHQLLAGAHAGSDALATLVEQLAVRPRLRQGLATALRGFGTGADQVLVHGRFAPANILQPSLRANGDLAPADAYVIGWLDATLGPPAYDVGHFVGELAELTALAREVGDGNAVARLRAATRAFYAAYVARSTVALPKEFPTQVAAFAALKITEHVIRFTTLYGDGGPSARRLLRAADDLLGSGGDLTEALIGLAPMSVSKMGVQPGVTHGS
jgi:hypothetical protein